MTPNDVLAKEAVSRARRGDADAKAWLSAGVALKTTRTVRAPRGALTRWDGPTTGRALELIDELVAR